MACLEELGLLGPNTKIRGTEVWMLCLWHPQILGREDTKIGSFSVNVETGASYCFSCGGGGNFADLVGLVTGADYRESVRWVIQRGVALEGPERLEKFDPPDAYEVSEASLAVFDEPPAAELKERRIYREDAEFFEILWEPRRGRWVFPIRTPSGLLLGWQEKMGSTVRNRPLKVPKKKTLFGADRFDSSEAVLVESPIDVAVLRSADIEGGLATWGSSISEEQVAILTDLTPYVISALDDDDAGNKAALGTLDYKGNDVPGLIDTGLGMKMRFLNYDRAGRAKDPGEMTPEQLRWAVSNARHAYLYDRRKRRWSR